MQCIFYIAPFITFHTIKSTFSEKKKVENNMVK